MKEQKDDHHTEELERQKAQMRRCFDKFGYPMDKEVIGLCKAMNGIYGIETISDTMRQYPYASRPTCGGSFSQPGLGRMGMPIVPPCVSPGPISCVPPNLSGLHGPQTSVKEKDR